MHVCVVTRNKSISATTLHSLMNINVYAYVKKFHIEVHFVENLHAISKLIKTGERIVWFDYGTNIDESTLPAFFEPFDKEVRVLVAPAVKDEIDWDMFHEKTIAGSKEPVQQRALTFDTDVGKKLNDGLYEVTKTSARVFAIEPKQIDKKIRGGKVPIKLNTDSYGEFFDQLLKLGIKVAASTKSQVTCHYIHECSGNILEAPGVVVGK